MVWCFHGAVFRESGFQDPLAKYVVCTLAFRAGLDISWRQCHCADDRIRDVRVLSVLSCMEDRVHLVVYCSSHGRRLDNDGLINCLDFSGDRPLAGDGLELRRDFTVRCAI